MTNPTQPKTVKQLIEQLQDLPPDDMVFINVYEGGISGVAKLRSVRVNLDVNPQWYYGDHEEAEDGEAKGWLIY